MGPPGNGKTAVCRAIATTTKVPVIYCSLADAEANVILSHLPWTICNNAPCILMMEDVDAMAENDSMRAGFLNILDGLAGEAGVLTIASTNCPDKLDPAFSARPSRFDELYVFENPTEQARREILSNKLGKRVGPKQIAQLAKKTNGLSAAFVQEVAVKTLRDSFLGDKPIAEKELAESLRKVRKHFSDSAKDWVGRIGFS
jgi:SpoVK/Ycf46/Vps4 family AAA+-type ATPase